MYHAIVRHRVRQLFKAINAGDAEPVLRGLAPRFTHRMLGEHALGGTRTTLPVTRMWYDRLLRLMPDIQFEIRDIVVAGGPWRTLIVVGWIESNSGTDGVRTTNSGIHAIELRWGRMTRLDICPDTVPLVKTLERLASAGQIEANAAPLIA